jgi:hypothetical protein
MKESEKRLARVIHGEKAGPGEVARLTVESDAPAFARRLSRPRWRVETVNGQLADRYRVKRLWARDLWHLCHRLIRKALCHTFAVWLNVTTGLAPLRFADLLGT